MVHKGKEQARELLWVSRQVDMLADINQEITARGDADVVAKACIDLIDAGSTSQLAEVVLVLARTDRAAVAAGALLNVSR